MATVTRRADSTVEAQLFADPYDFEFYQAVRILTSLRGGENYFGEGDNPRLEPVQIQSRISYAMNSSDIYSINRNRSYDRPPIMTVNFLGVAGIQGPLPQPYTELLADRLRQKDTAFRDFLDIFNHRLVSFWYRVQKKYIPGLEQVPVEETSVGKTILDLAGLSHLPFQKLLKLDTRSIVHFSPLFWHRQRSSAGLVKVFEGYFKCKVKIGEFFGSWRKPPPEDWSLIGAKKGRYNQLGQSIILGRRTWDQAAGVRIYLQGISWKHYLTHLPGGHGNDAFRELILFYGGLNKSFELRAALKRMEIPPSILGRKLYLGQTSWMTRGQGHGFSHDPEVLLMEERSGSEML